MEFNYIRRGAGKPLLLIHGIGGSWRSWQTILDELALERSVIAVDLPVHGDTPPLNGETTIATLADAVTELLNDNHLTGVDAVGRVRPPALIDSGYIRGHALNQLCAAIRPRADCR